MTHSRSIVLALCAAVLLPMASGAQGSLSTLGFGYPTGQFSTRALGTGGAVGEIDPLSVSNPASIASFGGSVLYFQADPEYRTLHANGGNESTTIARYPLIVAAFPVTSSIMLGLSASNFLDRSFQTSVRATAVAGDTTLATTNVFKSDGAISDVRLALAWSPWSFLKLGVGAHAIAGDNRVRNSQTFDDSTVFAALVDTATLGYTGHAYSGGFELLVANQLSLAGSYRRGGELEVKRGDTTLATANVPDNLGISVAYIGIRGTALAFRTSKDTWTRMQGLGSSSLRVTDSWDSSVGADVMGPKLGSNNMQLRAGYRWRTLPFELSTSPVDEKTLSFGAGFLVGRGGRGAIDIATLRSDRTTNSALSETAWTLSVGITVRP